VSAIAILHPGQMGAEVGRALVEVGHEVRWLPAGRGPGTQRRAKAAGLLEAGTVEGSDLVLSVCPPAAALSTARAVAGFRGVYVDANAVSPETAQQVATTVCDAGAAYVDGGIVGPPPRRARTTRLYLSGARADDVAAVFAGSRVEARVLSGGGTAASALKMSYAAWTKISAALLVSIRAVAHELGVEEALAEEWALSQPELAARLRAAQAAAESKGWRWEEEMRQISRTFAAAGEPPGFAAAAAELFARWPRPADD
jgi:3-hydroxyisobutyrate dehydrogenase-like beta-hydroxyacid dehydrogenase